MSVPRLALVVAAFLVGLSAGFFFTYEASVTLGLAEVDNVAYVATFQAINETVRNASFGVVFFGSIPAIAVALVINWRSGTALARGLIVAAFVLYLGGVAVTAAGNVPLNNDLAELSTLTPAAAADARAAFEDDWNRLNLVRTLAIVAGFGALLVAVGLSPASSREPSTECVNPA
jgi:uncharacterized membrane protein